MAEKLGLLTNIFMLTTVFLMFRSTYFVNRFKEGKGTIQEAQMWLRLSEISLGLVAIFGIATFLSG